MYVSNYHIHSREGVNFGSRLLTKCTHPAMSYHTQKNESIVPLCGEDGAYTHTCTKHSILRRSTSSASPSYCLFLSLQSIQAAQVYNTTFKKNGYNGKS